MERRKAPKSERTVHADRPELKTHPVTPPKRQWCVGQSHESSPQEMLIRNTSAENDFRVIYIN